MVVRLTGREHIDLALQQLANSNAITLDTSFDRGELEHEIYSATYLTRGASRGFIRPDDRSIAPRNRFLNHNHPPSSTLKPTMLCFRHSQSALHMHAIRQPERFSACPTCQWAIHDLAWIEHCVRYPSAAALIFRKLQSKVGFLM